MEIVKFKDSDRESYYIMSGAFYETDAAIHKCPLSIRQCVFDDIMSGSPYVEGYMITENGEEIGFAILANSYGTEFGKKVVWVEEIYIKDEFRCMGYGGRFMEWLETECRSRNAVMRLEVSPENERVFQFYYNAGFDDLEYSQMVKTEK